MTITPQYRVTGDYWSFTVQFKDPTSGNPIPLTSGLVPGGEFYQAYSSASTLDLTVTAGNVSITDPTNGIVVYVIPASVTASAIPQNANPPSFIPAQYPTRLQCFLTDSIGRQTYAVIGIVPINPRSTDLSLIPPATTVVAYAGPAGPSGPPGDPSLIGAAVASQIAALNLLTGSALDAHINALIATALAAVDAGSGVVPGSGVLSGSLTEQAPGTDALSGTIPGGAVVSGSLAASDPLAGTLPGSGTLVGSATTQAPGADALSGSVPGATTLTGSLADADALTGAIPGSATLTGAMSATLSYMADFSNPANSQYAAALAA